MPSNDWGVSDETFCGGTPDDEPQGHEELPDGCCASCGEDGCRGECQAADSYGGSCRCGACVLTTGDPCPFCGTYPG